jgi:hypothetical protein
LEPDDRLRENDELLSKANIDVAVGMSSLGNSVFVVQRSILVHISSCCGCLVILLSLVAVLVGFLAIVRCSSGKAAAVFILILLLALLSCLLCVCFVTFSNHSTKSCFCRSVAWSTLAVVVIGLIFAGLAFLRIGADEVIVPDKTDDQLIVLPTPCADTITWAMNLVAFIGILTVSLCALRTCCFPVIYKETWRAIKDVYPPPIQPGSAIA